MKTIIFDTNSNNENVPSGFNAVKVSIDGGVKSDLVWKDAIEAANEYIDQGFKIFWELDLGIFSGLRHPLTQTSQYLSLKLSVEHFRDTVWKEFDKDTVGVSLYRGTLDFSKDYLWDEEQEQNLRGWLEDHFVDVDQLNKELLSNYDSFLAVNHESLSEVGTGKMLLQIYCRDAAAEYIDLFVNQLPEELKSYLLFDTSDIGDSVHLENLLSKEHFTQVSLVLRCASQKQAWRSIGTDDGFIGRSFPLFENSSMSNIALCLPSLTFFKPSDYQELRTVFEKLIAKEINYRVIPEGMLTTEWEGLDYLIVAEKYLSLQGKRMLMGFCAAGGTVVCTDQEIGLPSEISLNEFMGDF